MRGGNNIMDHFKVLNLGVPQPKGAHVMLNPVVVENVVNYLKVNELKNCRLTQKEVWLPAATRTLKEKAMIYFDEHYDEEAENPDMAAEYRDLQHYLRNMSHFQTQSYCLGKGAKTTECEMEYRSFFEQFGSQIRNLRLEYEFHSHFDVAILRGLLINYLTNLEILDIRNVPLAMGQMTKFGTLLPVTNECIDGKPCLFPTGHPATVFPSLKRIEFWNYNAYPGELSQIFITQLITSAPNLNAIRIVDRYYDQIVAKVIEVIQTLPELKTNLRELEFDCCGSPTEADLTALTFMDLKLKVLRLGVMQDLKNPAVFQALLHSQSKTLVELQFGNIKLQKGQERMRIVLPRFENLERLELTTDIPNGAFYGFSFGPISYKDTFPVLKELANCRSQRFYEHDCMTTSETYSRISKWVGKNFFTGMGVLWKELFPEGGAPVHTLVKLDIPYPKSDKVKKGRDKFFIRLAKMFPQVNEEMLRQIRDGLKIDRPGYEMIKGKWVRSVDLLTEAVRLDLLPSHPEVYASSILRDYGFGNCKSTDEESKLLSVYTAVIKLMPSYQFTKDDHSSALKNLHEACIQGKLAEYILSKYREIEQTSNYYCAWFLKNLHLVDNPYPILEG